MAFQVHCFNGYTQYSRDEENVPSNKLVHITLTIKKKNLNNFVYQCESRMFL